MALQEYSLTLVSDSIKACSALYLALKITELNDKRTNTKSNVSSTEWVTLAFSPLLKLNFTLLKQNPTLIHYTDTFAQDFLQYVPLMNSLIRDAPIAKYKTIFKKYSHQYLFLT